MDAPINQPTDVVGYSRQMSRSKTYESKNQQIDHVHQSIRNDHKLPTINPKVDLEQQDSIINHQLKIDNIKVIDLTDQIHKMQQTNYDQIHNTHDDQQIKTNQNDDNQEKIIIMRNIHKTYLLGVEGVSALRGIDLNVYRGDFLIIYGASGGGKTSLLNVMGTIDKPTKGDLLICGHKIKSNTKDNILAGLRLSYLGFVFQTFNLVPSLNALENVELPMILQGSLSRSEIKKRAQELLEMVGLSKRQDHFPNQLSGGEQQRVTIARSLSNNPQILFLDEPTGDLDTKNTEIVMEILCKLNREQGITMIMVTHDKGLKFFANRVIRMVDGRIANQECISKEQQQMAEDNLKVQFQNDQNNVVGVREGIYQKQQGDESSSKTQIRTPESYPALFYQLKK